MAYFFGNKKKSSLMTQGFSNNSFDNTGHTTSHASKVNEGAITQYPYYISDDITTATTHSQYYQLALEQDEDKDGSNDIVVYGIAWQKNKMVRMLLIKTVQMMFVIIIIFIVKGM